MYVKPSVPLSIGGVLDEAFRLYRRGFSKSWRLALCAQLVLAVPAVILRYQMKSAASAAGNPRAALAVFMSPAVWLPYLIIVLVAIGFYNALIVHLDGCANSNEQPARQSLASGFRLFPRTLLLFLVMFVMLIVAGVGMGLAVAIGKAISPVISAVAIVAILAVAIYVWGRAFLAHVALVVENAQVFRSIEISWTFIKDHWWRTATVYTVALFIAVVFYFVMGFLDGIVAWGLHDSFGAATVLTQLVAIAGGTVLMSFLPAVLLSMYYDLKLRKQGADLAGRVNTLAPQ